MAFFFTGNFLTGNFPSGNSISIAKNQGWGSKSKSIIEKIEIFYEIENRKNRNRKKIEKSIIEKIDNRKIKKNRNRNRKTNFDFFFRSTNFYIKNFLKEF